MKKVLKRPRFLLDLAEELTWLNDQAGPDVAEEWYQSLLQTIAFLAKHPLAGRQRKDLSPPCLRSWRVSGFPRWLVFYAAGPDGQVVLYRIRQGTMNLLLLKME